MGVSRHRVWLIRRRPPEGSCMTDQCQPPGPEAPPALSAMLPVRLAAFAPAATSSTAPLKGPGA